MSHIRRNGHWIVALVGAMSIAWAAGVLAQRPPVQTAPAAPNPAAVVHPENPAVVSHGIAEGRALSAAFSHVAKDALPAIVSIEVRGRAMTRIQDRDGEESPFNNFGPFGDMFR